MKTVFPLLSSAVLAMGLAAPIGAEETAPVKIERVENDDVAKPYPKFENSKNDITYLFTTNDGKKGKFRVEQTVTENEGKPQIVVNPDLYIESPANSGNYVPIPLAEEQYSISIMDYPKYGLAFNITTLNADRMRIADKHGFETFRCFVPYEGGKRLPNIKPDSFNGSNIGMKIFDPNVEAKRDLHKAGAK